MKCKLLLTYFAIGVSLAWAQQDSGPRKGTRISEIVWHCQVMARSGFRDAAMVPANAMIPALSGAGALATLYGAFDYDLPDNANALYDWITKKGVLVKIRQGVKPEVIYRNLSPGDLLFWVNQAEDDTIEVQRVMMYVGKEPQNERHLMFGAPGTGETGMCGNGVDLFELAIAEWEPGETLIAYGKMPRIIR